MNHIAIPNQLHAQPGLYPKRNCNLLLPCGIVRTGSAVTRSLLRAQPVAALARRSLHGLGYRLAPNQAMQSQTAPPNLWPDGPSLRKLGSMSLTHLAIRAARRRASISTPGPSPDRPL